MSSKKPLIYKIVLVGPSDVGKTCLCQRFVDNSFSMDTKKTIGVDFALKSVLVAANTPSNPSSIAQEITLQLWDFAGEERFRTALPMYLAGTQAALLSFDLTRPETLHSLSDWLEVMRKYQEVDSSFPFFLVGMKADQEQIVPEDAIKAFKEAQQIEDYYATSAATGDGIEAAFQQITSNLLGREN
jgi:small GTP-binding protein